MSGVSCQIEILGPKNSEELYQHMLLCQKENGVGQAIFSPMGELPPIHEYLSPLHHDFPKPERFRKKIFWLCRNTATQEIMGHHSLHYFGMPSHIHRRVLGIAVLKSYQGMGIGKQMMQHCIQWCKNNSVEYLDLGVFETNVRAYEIYKKLGFQETGRIIDLFRVHGQSLNDIQMTLKIEKI